MAVGLFGKYPAKRDFVTVNLPRGVLAPVENWLLAAVATSRDKLGGEWTDRFLVQPIWNFRIGRAIAGVDCLGALAPSVDGVGRYFPLAIIAHSESGFPGFAENRQTDWFAAVHRRLVEALDDNAEPDPVRLVADLPEPQSAGAPPDAETIAGGRCARGDPEADDFAARVSALETAAANETRTAWWTRGSALVKPQYNSFAAMPGPGFYAAMMGDGG
ncbi:MAG: type VI secretion system-associated protein TagF [Phyllobacteriaceae bacterium]|nr:type VI secretion system-associated protein TagF [Phyllobacteriaceae bacterium]